MHIAVPRLLDERSGRLKLEGSARTRLVATARYNRIDSCGCNAKQPTLCGAADGRRLGRQALFVNGPIGVSFTMSTNGRVSC
jgi:hypothetical protein